jgi:hypothetical protein
MFNLLIQRTMYWIKLSLSLILIYMALLGFVFLIPIEGRIERNVQEGLSLLHQEGDYPIRNANDERAMSDNFTDKIILSNIAIDRGDHLVVTMLDINGYHRYWHGYLAIYKPIFLFLNYAQLRLANQFMLCLSVLLIVYLILKRWNILIALTYLGSLLTINIQVIPYSLQFMSVIMIMQGALILILLNEKRMLGHLTGFFFIIGSLTSFLDLLTAPVLTLGIPLILVYLLTIKNNENTITRKLYFHGIQSIAWVSGYLLTWMAKWLISFPVLDNFGFKDILNIVRFRMMGNVDYPLDRLKVFELNQSLIFDSTFNRVLISLVTIWVIGMLFYAKPLRDIKILLPLLLIAVIPYAWLLLAANHSQIHYWFTYRILSITVMAVGIFMIETIDFNKISNNLSSLVNNE